MNATVSLWRERELHTLGVRALPLVPGEIRDSGLAPGAGRDLYRAL